jgi:hypothetical protein
MGCQPPDILANDRKEGKRDLRLRCRDQTEWLKYVNKEVRDSILIVHKSAESPGRSSAAT